MNYLDELEKQMNAPEWNKNVKEQTLKDWIKMLNAEARRQFLEAGTHLEIVFLFNDDGLMNIAPISGMEKEEIISGLKRTLNEKNGYAYIHIVETTAKALDNASEADSLLLIAESRDGLSQAWFHTIAKKGDEKLLLDAVQVDGSKGQGRFTGIFETK
jgi:deoxyxylulose-5-phosphate synthase